MGLSRAGMHASPFRRSRPWRPAAVLAVGLLVGGTTAHAQGAPHDPDDRLYAATIAAAAAALNLHDTPAAAAWLDEAPADRRAWEWGYLRRLSDQRAAAWPLHRGALLDLALSPDGRTLATVGADSTARLLDAASGAVRHTLRGHQGTVWRGRFAPDGRSLATVSSDGTLRLWDVASGRLERAVDSIGAGVAGLAWSPDGRRVATASWFFERGRGVWGVVAVWDARTGDLMHRGEHGRHPYGSLAWSPDGATLVAGNWDGHLAAWALDDWDAGPRILEPPDDPYYKHVNDVAFSPAGDRLAAACQDGVVRIWDVAAGRLTEVLDAQLPGGRRAPVHAAAWEDDSTLAFVGGDFTLRRWRLGDRYPAATRRGPRTALRSVATRDGVTWVGDADGAVARFDPDDDAAAWRGRTASYGIAFDPDGARIATAGWEGWVHVRDARTGHALRAWQGHEGAAVAVAWTPDGQHLLTTGNDGAARLWHADTGDRVADLPTAAARQLLAAAVSPTGDTLAVGLFNGLIRRYHRSGTLLDSLAVPGATGRVEALVWSEAGLAAATGDGLRVLWARAAAPVLLGDAGPGGHAALAALPDGAIVSGGPGGRLAVWTREGARRRSLDDAGAPVVQLAASPDGTRVAATLRNKTAAVWNVATGRRLLTVDFDHETYPIAWHPDGHTLMVGTLDGGLHPLVGGGAAPDDSSPHRTTR